MIALWTRNERYHGSFAIFAFGYLIVYPWFVFDTVG
jgi:hypothetical protein